VRLKNKLNEWIVAGLLTSSQADAILAHEAGPSHRNWVLLGFSGIGVTAIAAGIISLIAANWHMIPPTVKLINYFTIQTAMALLVLKYLSRTGIIRECAITLFALLFFAGIALVGQVYNLVSSGYPALFFWAVLVFPLIMLVQSRLLPQLWFAVLTVALCMWIADSDSMQLARVLQASLVAYFATAAGLWKDAKAASWIQTAALRWGGTSIAVISSSVGTMLWNAGDNDIVTPLWSVFIPVIGAIFATLSVDFTSWSRRLKLVTGATFIASALFVSLPPLLRIGDQQVVACAGFVIVWLLGATAAAIAKHRQLFDVATVVIGVRLVVAYFEVFGTLAATGAGLIISGILILGATFTWHRYRARLRVLLGGA
jgi:uncharacterized membrane protein